VVLPHGEVGEFTGPGLDLVADAGGTTGLISEVTFRVQPLEDLDVLAIGCTTPRDLQILAEIEKTVRQPLVKEGIVIREGREGKSEAVLLGFIPADQRKFTFNFVFGLVLTIIRIAKNHGSRA
jgi:hypothetical protein